MSTEEQKIAELLKPRYKVIADYPSSRYSVGQVVNLSSMGERKQTLFYSKYPAVFRLLKWWEERDIRNMDIYVKYTDHFDGKKVKVFKSSNLVKQDDKEEDFYGGYFLGSYHISCLELATSDEYTTYQSPIKQ